MLTAKTSKRLQTTQAQFQETSYAQAQLQETSNQTELQRNLFEFEHLIYNQWCSQYKSNTNFLRLYKESCHYSAKVWH